MEVDNLFSILDYIILILSLLVPIVVGIYYGVVNKKTTEDLLLGGRKMKIFPVAASIMASTVSAITVLGFPAEVYSYGIQIFEVTLLSIIYIPISVYIFIPYFYPMRLTSVYEYLELRFNSVGVRLFASFTFMFQQIVLAGIILYAPSIALEAFLGFSPLLSIMGIGIAGTIYTSIGGLKAVVWTDTFQMVLMYVGIIAILIKGFLVAGGITRAFELAAEGGRLNIFDFTIDPFMRHNSLNFALGFAVIFIIQPGVRQHEVQRYSSLPTVEAAKLSMLLSIPIKVIALAISLLTGVAIYAVYAGCDPILLGELKKADELVPLFVVKELAFIPGMLGLFTSCMFCALLSSYSSSLNGIVAVTWKDFLSKLSVCQKMEESSRSRLSILVGVVYGILIVTLAMFAKHMGAIYQASLAVTGPPAGVLAAVFLMALFMPFVEKHGALYGMIIGLASSVFICFQAFSRKFVHPKLDTSISNCSSFESSDLIFKPGRNVISDIEWPDKIYTLSYALYPAFAAIVTLISGISISLIFRALSNEIISVDSKYLHPFVRKKVPEDKYCNGNNNDNVNCVKNGTLKLDTIEAQIT